MALSGLGEPARPSGHPVKMTWGERKCLHMAPGGELSDLGQWGEKQVLPSRWRLCSLHKAPASFARSRRLHTHGTA